MKSPQPPLLATWLLEMSCLLESMMPSRVISSNSLAGAGRLAGIGAKFSWRFWSVRIRNYA